MPLNTRDLDLAASAARVAKLEAELAETRRVNAAWRALHVRSVLVLGRIAKCLDAALTGPPGPDARSLPRGERRPGELPPVASLQAGERRR